MQAAGLAVALLIGAADGWAAAALSRQPYLQSLGQSSLKILWRTAVPAAQIVDYGIGTYTSHAYEAALTTHHEVRIDVLAPGTLYSYQIREGETVVASGPDYYFRTDAGPHAHETFSFFAAGDVGETIPPGQQIFTKNRILQTMPRADFGILLGDNIYPSGMSSAYDANLMGPWADLLCNTPVWPALGNHDWLVNPDSNFALEWALPNNEHYFSYDYGNAHFVALDSRDGGLYDLPNQLTWLEADLTAASRTTWKFVYYHHPFHTCTYKGDIAGLASQLGPIFDRHHVDVVFNGHAHTYERLHPQFNGQSVDTDMNPVYEDPHGTIYIVSGCGSKFMTGIPTTFCGPTAFFLDERILFTLVTIDDYTANISEIDSYTGAVVDHIVIHKSVDPSGLGLAPPPLGLRQNVPNPFNPRTAIPFQLDAPGWVRVGVYRPDGTWVANLENRLLPAGAQSVAWNGRDSRGLRVASGPYLCRLEVGGRAQSIKMTLVQ